MTACTEARGYMIQSCIKFLEDTYGPEDKKRFYAGLPKPLMDKLPSVSTVNWYPRSDVAALFTGFALLHQGDEKKAYAALDGCGYTIGQGAINTYLKLLLRFMTIGLFAKKIQSFWSRDHKGGQFDLENLDTDKRVLRTVHSGIAGYDYVAGTAPGFIRAGLEALGQTNVRVSTEGFTLKDHSPDRVVYTVSWD
ncbi:MAG TPA: hypothetical protein VH044_05650 [Polyangiaceae bacterium]|jgi:hypothetical protein|nr:hypothetical protein [Polyangiaceae bacterium]